MKLSDYKKRDNGFCDYEKDGISYQDAEGVLLSGFFDFCMCGCPSETLELLYHVLKNIDSGFEHWDERKKRDDELMFNDGIRYLVWNVLDREDMIEHGSSLPGWLTQKGRDYLSLLEEWVESQKKKSSNANEDN